MPCGAEVGLAAVDDARSPRPRCGVRRRARSGCRRRRRAAAAPAARTCRRRSRARRTASRSGVVVSDRLVTIVRSSVLLPLRGPPTTATWPPAPARSTRERVAALLARPVDGAERARRGRRAARHAGETRPSSRVLDEVAASARRGCRGRRAAAATPGAPRARGRASGRRRCRAATAARRARGAGSGSRLRLGRARGVSTSEIVNGRMPLQVAALVAAHAGAAATAGRRRRPP